MISRQTFDWGCRHSFFNIMADRRDLRQHVIALIENGLSASEAGKVSRGLINFKIMGSVKGAILQGARIVRQGKRTKLFGELMKRTHSAL